VSADAEAVYRAVVKMSEWIPFFPKTEGHIADLASVLCGMLNSDEELNWLVATAINSMTDWQKSGGIAGLRSLYCSRFRPADGFIPEPVAEKLELNYESRRIEIENQELEIKLARWKHEKLLASGSSTGVFTPQQQIAAAAPVKSLTAAIAPKHKPKPRPNLAQQVMAFPISQDDIRQGEEEIRQAAGCPTRTPDQSLELVRRIESDIVERQKSTGKRSSG
jgi:hypothetical protein